MYNYKKMRIVYNSAGGDEYHEIKIRHCYETESVVGKILYLLKNIYMLIPRTCECVSLHGKGDGIIFADVIKVAN